MYIFVFLSSLDLLFKGIYKFKKMAMLEYLKQRNIRVKWCETTLSV